MNRYGLAALTALALMLGAMRAESAAIEPDLAMVQAADSVALADILSGEARIGFTPQLTPGVPLQLRAGEVSWVRVRAEMPARAAGEWVLRIERTALERVRLYLPPASARAQATVGFFDAGSAGLAWGSAFRLPLPAGPAGQAEWYLAVEGMARVGLIPQVMTAAEADAADARAARWWKSGVVLVLLVFVLAVVRFFQHRGSGAGSVAFASATLLVACLAYSGVLYALPGGQSLASLGLMGLWMALLLPCGPLLLATAGYSGLPYSLPRLVPYVRGVGFALPVLALLLSILRVELSPLVQILMWLVWLKLVVACLVLLFLDSRNYRWAPIFFWVTILLALAWRAGIEWQWLSASNVGLFGVFPAVAALLASMLLLPWLRSAMQQQQISKRAVPAKLSSMEKISQAREQLLESLQAGLGNAAEGDVEWIAFRRLLTGLKPVLPQMSSAVMAMNYRGTDMLQVEPMGLEQRYRALLAQRSSLLRGLSRSRGPQQITLDFDGPDGPLAPVQLAVIPLPIDKPGWGVLLVERPAGVSYSEEELALCTEFASLATTASDEAAVSVKDRQETEIDPDTGVYRAELIEAMLKQQVDLARTQAALVSVLRMDVEGLEVWQDDEAIAGDALRKIADVLRDELAFGESVGRLGAASFLLVLPEKDTTACRQLAERIITAVATLGLPPDIKVAIGISTLRKGELNAQALLGRAADAVLASRRSGSPSSA